MAMKWDKLPPRTSISMSKADVEKLNGSSTSTFVTGMVTGAIALLILQGCVSNDSDKPDKPVQSPAPTASQN